LEAENEFYENNILTNPDNYINVSFWNSAYKIIYQVNACIEGLNESSSLSAQIRNRLLGECKFMRAYLFFNLVNLYGGVPLVTSTNFESNATLPRTTSDLVYELIEDDLRSSESLLPESFSNKLRPTKNSARALLARVALFQSKWAEAELLSTKVIENGEFLLESNLNDVFLPDSREAIWQIMPVDLGYNTPLGTQFVPTTAGKPRYAITEDLYNAFESGDQRIDKWLKSKTVASVFYIYPYKYKLRFDGNSTPSEYFVPLRLAEQYLIRAEARARQNILLTAKDDLNKVRNRAGLANSTASSQMDILTAIDKERRTEFFCEEGHRWFDLKRLNTVNETLSVIKAPGWQETDQLYPIPFSQILYNPALTQNPGY